MDKLSLFPVIFRIHFHLLPPFHLSCPIKICAPQALIGASWNFYGVKNFYGKWHKIGKSNSKSCCTHFCTTSHNLYWNWRADCLWLMWKRKLWRNIAVHYSVIEKTLDPFFGSRRSGHKLGNTRIQDQQPETDQPVLCFLMVKWRVLFILSWFWW